MISYTCCLKCSVFRSYDLGFVFPTQKSSQSQPLALYITFRTFEHESACPSEGRKDLIRRVFCSLRAGSLVSTFRHRYTGDGEKNGTTKSDFSSSHSSRRLAFSVPSSEPAYRPSVLENYLTVNTPILIYLCKIDSKTIITNPGTIITDQ